MTLKRKTVFLFSGQGSQYYQMGRDLYDSNPIFRASMDRMDQLVRERLGTSVVQAVYGPHGKADPFDDIRLTHPAIFMVEFALAQAAMALGIRPDLTLGVSLGTFAALAIGGRLSAEAALARVLEQALAIEAHSPPGGMIAVLGEPDLYHRSPFLQARSVIAGINFSGHFVLSAPQHHLAEIRAFLARADVVHQSVTVRYPFHSPWMEPVRTKLSGYTEVGHRLDASLPVICCATGGALQELPEDYFWQVMRNEMSFQREIDRLEPSGPFNYVDLSPSGTLATLLKYLLPKASASSSIAIMTPFGQTSDALAAAAEQCRAGEPQAMGWA
ncbi:MAG: acyltransferase domain-containing protein [Gammaproteobacteria bacterium]